MSEAARQAGAAQLVCTQKDWVKLRYDPFAGVELSALRVDFRITAGAEDLLALIRR